MIVIGGIISGLLTALLQSLSYVCSAAFIRQYRSPLRLVIFSQLAMGAFCLPFSFWVFPPELLDNLGRYLSTLLVWVIVFSLGQISFFAALRSIEPSRLSSLLGLKIILLSLFSVVILNHGLGTGKWMAVLLATLAAVGMNWSGGKSFTPIGLFWLLCTLVFYSLADITETKLVLMMPIERIGIIRAAIASGIICYTVLGAVTLFTLTRFRWTTRQFVKSIPFAAFWFTSQVSLFVCFGLIGPVFGNVIQSSRGMISIAIGMLLMYYKVYGLDAKISPRMWLRRAVAAVLMTTGIILYAVSE